MALLNLHRGTRGRAAAGAAGGGAGVGGGGGGKTTTVRAVRFAVLSILLFLTVLGFFQQRATTATLDLYYWNFQQQQQQQRQQQGPPLQQQQLANNNDSRQTTSSVLFNGYMPSESERYAVEHAEELGLTATKTPGRPMPMPTTCRLWTNASLPVHLPLQQFRKELDDHEAFLRDTFRPLEHDIRTYMKVDDPQYNADVVCDRVDVLRGGSAGRGGGVRGGSGPTTSDPFPSNQLSHGEFGFIEPLLPPLRSPDLCFPNMRRHILDPSYLVHDFGAMCRTLKPTSRTVLVDLGASLVFHRNASRLPVVELAEQYRRMGFVFDHIYAFEKTFVTPEQVYAKVPEEWLPAYHWINVGVESDKNSRFHPFEWISRRFGPDDFIVFKLDVDTPEVELPLARQLLEDDDEHGNNRYRDLIDVFYFEMHVHMKDLAPWWGTKVQGSVLDAIDLFAGLRRKGVAAHAWV